MEPLVYIILVNYNNAKDTIECVRSLSSITYSNYKVIVVDNGSSDNSSEILKFELESSVQLLFEKQNLGFSYGNNVGIKYACQHQADYVLLLNNDTVVEKNFLNYLIHSFEPNVGISIGSIYYFKEKSIVWYAGGSLNHRTAKVRHDYFNEQKDLSGGTDRFVTFATGCCMCISIEAIKTVGLLDECYFLYEEDVDYCSRVLEKGFLIKYVPKATIYHKVSASTGVQSPLSQYYLVRNKFIFIKKNILRRYRVVAYVYSICMFAKRVFCKEIKFKYFNIGYKDFIRKVYGKSGRKF